MKTEITIEEREQVVKDLERDLKSEKARNRAEIKELRKELCKAESASNKSFIKNQIYHINRIYKSNEAALNQYKIELAAIKAA